MGRILNVLRTMTEQPIIPQGAASGFARGHLPDARAAGGSRIEYEGAWSGELRAYGMYRAALQAKALGFSRVTGIEFGVFNGIGLATWS